MEIRNETAVSTGRQVSPARPGDERRSREGEWQPAPASRETTADAEPEAAVSPQAALRGRWVTDARQDESRRSLDEIERSHRMRRRVEETYHSVPVITPSAARGWSGEAIDLVV